MISDKVGDLASAILHYDVNQNMVHVEHGNTSLGLRKIKSIESFSILLL